MHRSEHDPDLHAIALEAMAQSLVDQWAKDPYRAGEAGMCLSDDEYDADDEYADYDDYGVGFRVVRP